ncbi:hypothetical protein DBZ36_01605 [Alginatibacterium sediminis]|uniref:MSHA biogenesis protein MshF n=1 Tax=Alginatibacterium sediminis TaxID=2164068 RepID=A0A420ELA0_9ALTE|nr:hypothetical protein [Alginatibacterium sediminis]RKF21374.1 hypothetical protein DBZ36_01605 [Alginatibacterium sediminis]
MTSDEVSEQGLKLNRFMAYVVLILLMVLMLLRAVMGVWPQAEQQLATETRNAWVNQLSMLRGRWLYESKPKELALSFQGGMSALSFSDLGWPIVSSKSDCTQLWQIIFDRSDIEFNNLLAQVDKVPSQKSCQYRFSDAWVFYYDASVGRVWWQDDGRVEF